jgi:site-specific DNA recombinase
MVQSATPPWLVGPYPPALTNLAAEEVLRVAFLARTSTDDLQDPTISIPRQLNGVEKALPDRAVIVAYYYDVESGRSELSKRGTGNAHEKFDIPVPRTGSIKDMMQEACKADRAFDVVMCESIDRIARKTYYSTRLEHLLEEQGVALLAADEPIVTTRRKLKNATTVLTRRVKQGISEWYVLDLLEKSWGGFEVHTQMGFNVGKALYGYNANRTPHPVPEKRAAGKSKTTLVVDTIRAAVVRRIFDMRIGQRLGYIAIAEKLNEDLALNPPPVPPDPARARGSWSGPAVREILRNPKYTGYMVWNRVKCTPKGNRPNPMDEWVWSAEQTHEAIISPERFTVAQEIGAQSERKRSKKGKRRVEQEAYRFRSAVRCGMCRLLMYGKRRETRIYYSCHPKRNAIPTGHPSATYVREEAIDGVLSAFLKAFLIGSCRSGRIRELIAKARSEVPERLAAERKAVVTALTDVDARRSKLIQALELAEEMDSELVASVSERQRQLSTDRKDLTARLDQLEQEIANLPDPGVVDLLPMIDLDITQVPDDLVRRLLQAFRIELSYDPTSRHLTCSARISRELVPTLRELLAEERFAPKNEKYTPHTDSVRVCDMTRPGYPRYCLRTAVHQPRR